VTDPARRRRVEELCDAALTLEGTDRAAFLADSCGDDEALRREVEALLAHAQTAEEFLAVPLGAVAAGLLTDEPRALVGRQIGGYRILSLLGSGGMGEVYCARDTRLGRDVALKILPSAFTNDPERLARFEREARVLAALNHPNIATIHGIEESPSAPSGQAAIQALVMEFVEGETLAERIARGPIPVKDALGIARQIAEALDAAHERGIIHRDLKPANVKITPGGVVKVLDFGLAKIAGSLSLHAPSITIEGTREGQILGTAAYMSPEQARGQAVDRRTDIWAFGCVLWEMLVGRPPFARDTFTDTLAAIVEQQPDWSQLPGTTPAPIRHLLAHCLEKNRQRRLRDIGDSRIEAAASDATAVTFPRPMHQARWRLIAAASTTALVVALVAGGAVLRRIPTDTRAFRSAIVPPEGVTLANSVTPNARFAVSPDGRRLAFIATEAGGVRRLYVQSLDELTAQPLAGTEDAALPFWSPDSRSIGFIAEGKLKRIDATGGPPLVLADPVGGTAGASWGRDDVILFANYDAGNPIQRVSASGGAVSPETRLDAARGETRHWFPFFLPNGRHFLYVAVGSPSASPVTPNGIYVAAIDSNERKLLAPGGSTVRYAEGFLFFLREQTLMAQRFDVERLELSGDAVPVAEGVTMGGASGAAGAFSISDSGVLAYQTGPAEAAGFAGVVTQFAWFDRSGREIGVVGDEARYGDIELAPDGRRVAVSVFDRVRRARDVFVVDAASGLRTRLTFDPADEYSAIWSPDGSRLLFNSRRKGHLDLYEKVSTGAGAETELLTDDRDKYPTDWSRDGQFVLFAVYTLTGRYELWALPLSGDRKPFLLLKMAGSSSITDQAPAQFSPDGRWIAYVSIESGRNEVYVTPFPGLGGKWQISSAGGNFPRWSNDGNEIFYLTPDNRLMAAAVNGAGAAFQVSGVRPLFDVRAGGPRSAYDVTPDGKRFLVNTTKEDAMPAPITLVVNWQAVLTDR
jgi:Tol biopolymer transport system component